MIDESAGGPTGVKSQWEYNDATHHFYASRTIDTRGKATSFTYDSKGNVLKIQNAATTQNEASNTYDSSNGNVLTSTDFKGNVTSYGYDTLGRLTSVDNPAPLGDT